MNNDRKIFSGFLGAIATTGVTAAVAFVQLRILVAHLPLEMAGIWILFLSIGTYVLFFDLGISPTMGREISFTLGSLDRSPSDRAVRDAAGFVALVAMAKAALPAKAAA